MSGTVLYTLTVCPKCRGLLRFPDQDPEGMSPRTTCCGQTWIQRSKWDPSPGISDPLVIQAIEVRP
jgi:hypothetical protein